MNNLLQDLIECLDRLQEMNDNNDEDSDKVFDPAESIKPDPFPMRHAYALTEE